MSNYYPVNLPPTQIGELPAGIPGIRAVLAKMVMLTKEGRRDMGVRTLALRLVRDLPAKRYADEVVNLFQFVQRRIRYIPDMREVETLQSPGYTLSEGQGDCDDMSTLTAALLESIGHSTRFDALALGGGPYSHVIAVTRIGTRWLPLDTTVSYAYVGWEPPNITGRISAHV